MSVPDPSKKDGMQVLKYAFDDATGSLRTNATLTADGAEVEISHSDDSIKIGDGTDFLAINADGSINANISAVALPTGASTSAKQDTQTTALGSILSELQAKADLTETQPVSVVSLPLPSGASTSANQTTTHTKLDTLHTDLSTMNSSVAGTTKEQVLAANDAVATFTWSDFGLSTQRLASIDYDSATVGYTATKTFAYTNVGGVYRLDSATWSVS